LRCCAAATACLSCCFFENITLILSRIWNTAQGQQKDRHSPAQHAAGRRLSLWHHVHLSAHCWGAGRAEAACKTAPETINKGSCCSHKRPLHTSPAVMMLFWSVTTQCKLASRLCMPPARQDLAHSSVSLHARNNLIQLCYVCQQSSVKLCIPV
jgi:hypothetical protein